MLYDASRYSVDYMLDRPDEAPEIAAELTRPPRDGGSDVSRAEFIANELENVVIHIPGPGWLVWDGRVWRGTTSDAPVRSAIHNVSASLYNNASMLQTAGETQRAAMFAEIALKFRHTSFIDKVMKEIKAMPQLAREVSDLDGHRALLTFRNGIVDLTDGKLHPHTPEYYLTRLVDIDYDPDAVSERWANYLAASQPDPEVREFLQRAAGYGVTGETREECLLFFYGSGRNGKGVFTETIGHLFGRVAAFPLPDFWYRTGRKGSLVASLHGARLAMSSEMAGQRLDEQFLKAVVAADTLTADPKYQASYDFKPQCLVIMSGNEKPQITGTDDGVWRRFRCVNWGESFVGREDFTLKSDLLTSREQQGIAAWVVRGAVKWYRHGLPTPKAVTDATDEYRDESDPYTDWMDARLDADPEGFVTAAQLETSAREFGVKVGTKNAVTSAVMRHFPDAVRGQGRVEGRKAKGIRGVSIAKTPGGRIFES